MGNPYLSLAGVLIGLACMIYFAFRGVPVMALAPGCAIIIIVLSGMPIQATIVGTYMQRFGTYATSYFLLFFTSAIFGAMMGMSGASLVIADWCAKLCKKFPGKERFFAVCSVALISTILAYGGISTFVIVFALISIARNIFEELDVPWEMYTWSSIGSGCLSLTVLPGTPTINNITCSDYFGTTPMAAPVLSLILAVIAIVLFCFCMNWRLNSLTKKGYGFLPSGTEIQKTELAKFEVPNYSLLVSLLPCIVLLVLLNVVKLKPPFCLFFGCLTNYILFRKEWKNLSTLKEAINRGTTNSLQALGNTAMVVGFGAVMAASPAYELVLGALDALPGSGLVKVVVAVNVAAGMTGSSSGGLAIALESLADKFLATGINPQILHRLAAVSSGGLDSLPHCGAVITTLTVTKLGHKYGYFGYGFVTVIIPLVLCVVGIILGGMGIC